jgi:hypothetical protein
MDEWIRWAVLGAAMIGCLVGIARCAPEYFRKDDRFRKDDDGVS